MSKRDFRTAILEKNCASKASKAMLKKLIAVETQAIELVKLFKEERYVPVEKLLGHLQAQKVPRVDLVLLIAFLSGYLSEGYEARFQTAVFGPMSIGEGNEITVQASLVALVTMISQKNVFGLPNRVPRQEKVQPKKAVVPKNHKRSAARKK